MEIQNIRSRVIKTEDIEWEQLVFIQSADFKQWSPSGAEKLVSSLIKYQFVDPFKVWQHEGKLYCLDGRHRWLDLKEAKDKGADVPAVLPATFIDCGGMQEAAELVLVYSSAYARITETGLKEFVANYNLEWDELKETIELPNFDPIDLEQMMKGSQDLETDIVITSLQERFIVPPFSVLDTRQGYWQDRKKLWNRLGFDSQETREEVELIAKSGQAPSVYKLRNEMRQSLGRDPEWDEIIATAKAKGMHIFSGASVFDPVLCEVAYTWFCPPNAKILDPFAGGSVRGIVAATLNHGYYGIDLREDQVAANEKQALRICKPDQMPTWAAGDSNIHLDSLDEEFDFVFSCPPYHDLEKYSDDPADLSNMSYDEFAAIYRSIITKSIARLKQDRFACFVVADIRDEKGFYRDFVSETIDCFTKCIDSNGANVKLYNEIILVNVVASTAIRVGRQFTNGRKVGKTHQNILVFYKGDPSKIKENFPEIKLPEDLHYPVDEPNIALHISQEQ